MTHTSIFAPEVKAIEIIDNNESLVDVSTLKKCLISNKYENFYPTFKLVRKEVANRLQAAIKKLPEDIFVLFVEGHRPLQVQEAYFSQYSNALRTAHPEWDEETIFNEAAKLFAPPSKIPPHSTGAAMDITLCDKDGNELDLGSPIDDDPDKNEGRNFLDAQNISETAQQNRNLLKEIMSENGFVHYDYEWWHWSYGDQYWAYKSNYTKAIYDSIDAASHKLWREPRIMDVMASTGV